MLDVFLKVRDICCSQVENHPLQEAPLRSKAALGSGNIATTQTWGHTDLGSNSSSITHQPRDLRQVTELLNLSLLPECTSK